MMLKYLHYLRSPRSDTSSYGVFDPARAQGDAIPIALFSFAPFDLSHFKRSFAAGGLMPRNVGVLARVYVAPRSPKNLISYGMSMAIRWHAENNPELRCVVSYINPNVGFDGASLRASNWRLFAREERSHYIYFNGRYMTDREAVARFGSAQKDCIAALSGVEFSKQALRPLHLYAIGIDSEARSALLANEASDKVEIPDGL